MEIAVVLMAVVVAVVATKYWFSLNLDTKKPFPDGPGRAFLCGSR